MNNKSMLKLNKYNPLILLVAGTTIACAGASIGQESGADDVATTAEVAAPQAQAADVSCEMAFTMKGWSAIISRAEGEGVVTCDNGQIEAVTLAITGGGLTFGKTTIDDGNGVFTQVADISEIFGDYAQAEATAGAMDEAVGAQAMTKGEVSLAITTKGRGWSIGVSGAKFSITRPIVTEESGDGS